jgi:glycosyltransferase involved in cell wall biosynthesis
LVGDRNNFVWFKRKMYNYLLLQTDAAMAVCTGMLTNNEVSHKVLTPGIINEDVTQNIDFSPHKIEKGKPVKIFLTGGTHYSKGPDLLIKALKYINYPCEVHFIGNGSFDSAAQAAIKDIPSIHKVTIDGYFKHAALIKLLTKDADILMNTTRNMGVALNSAGFPFKMMEYAAIGRPIVSSQIGKLDEEYNRHITYYDTEDPEAVAKAINDVIINYEGKMSLSNNLQKLVLNKYTIKGVSETLSDFFGKLKKTVPELN